MLRVEIQRKDEVCPPPRLIVRYYLSLTCRKYYGKEAAKACQRDKAILQKPVLPLRSDVFFEDTVRDE